MCNFYICECKTRIAFTNKRDFEEGVQKWAAEMNIERGEKPKGSED